MKNFIKNDKFKMLNIFKILITFLIVFSSPVLAQTPITTDSRIRTLVYNPNEVYELKFFYNYQSFIEFSADEEIEMISIGEAFAWRLTPAGKRLFIRPLEIAAHTNMTIITNKRTYHFDIRSDEYSGKADEDLVYTIRFFYPQIGQPLPIPPQLAVPNIAPRIPVNPAITKIPKIEEIVRTPTPQTRIDEPLPSIIERNPEGVELNFDYRVAGRSDDIMPLKVYDDGAETHFQFANDNLVIPTISLVDNSGSEIPLTYVVRDRYVVIPTISRQFTLRLSDGLLCIFNNKIIEQSR